ncbi:aldehyde dehydrogenase family protein [Isachenkonia alkalipeptolytica]|uniref:Aldehyde dehydrogenase n=1 Tax=Isachenkonia alkalipeptolytica TaxID=2565777 RepID=A0AA44BET4_9CLOT|nr:aldehyde dehydrogenase family protein [Isachenkonia alkalipeptolytica]NBG89292.1 aldehyde dehydrogenase family protein [Isachenkonia alkalipeptolytica]
MDTLQAINPSTGEIVGEYQRSNPVEVKKVVEDSQRSFENWKQVSIKKRMTYLKKIRKNIMDHLDEYANIISKDTGKVLTESLMSDILPTLEFLRYYEKNTEDFLKPKNRDTPLTFQGGESYITYKPLGVIGIISPWNFPFQLSMVPIITALAAGNTVVIKPSNVTPTIGALIDRIMIESGLPQGVVQVVQGGREVGAALIEAKPNKIFFTGSVATGKKIMEQASKHLIPVELELGGKDPMLVLKDANIDRAVEGALYGGFVNSGQVCISVERLYLQEEIAEEFMEKLKIRVKQLNIGSSKEDDIGAMTSVDQIVHVQKQIEDAVKMGAILETPVKIEKNFFYPVVLTGVNHEMEIMQEETFGPVLPIMTFKTQEEGVALANDSQYGLNASIWTKDRKNGEKIAGELITGNVMINDVVRNVVNPDLPFGGVKDSGIGKYHGPEGLYSFSLETSVMVNKGKDDREINWFPYSEKKYRGLTELLKSLNTDKNLLKKGGELLRVSKKLKKMD